MRSKPGVTVAGGGPESLELSSSCVEGETAAAAAAGSCSAIKQISAKMRISYDEREGQNV